MRPFSHSLPTALRRPLLRAALLAVVATLPLIAGPPAVVRAQAPERIDVLIGFQSAPGPADQALVRGRGGAIGRTFQLIPAMAANIPSQAVAGATGQSAREGHRAGRASLRAR